MSTRVTHSLLRFVLLLTMILAVSMPTAAFAAPAMQGLGTKTDEAVLLAYYESDEISPTGEGSAVIGLSFYDDDTFEMSIDTLDGEDPSVGYGDYAVTDDGVTITLIGADGEDFEESTEISLLWDADDTLVITGEPDGIFGEEDIILYPLDVEGDTATSDGLDKEADEDSDDIPAVAVGGVYISPMQPFDGSAGVVYLLNLLDNGDASLNSDYLDMEAPIFEVGTWTDNEDGSVTVEITGTVEEEYDDSILIEFTLGDYGELMLEGFSLYPLEILSYLEDDATTADEELGSEDTDVFIYVAEVNAPGEDAPIYIYMFLYDDGSVIMTDADETTTLYGDWTFEDEILSVSLTSDDETVFDEPGELVFEFNDEDALVATEYPVDVFGEDELIFYPSDEGDAASDTEGEFFFYESEPLPSTETDGIIISLVLSGDGDALISSDFMNDEDTYIEYGTWTRDDDGNVVVSVTGSQDEEYDEPYVFTFAEDEDDLSLTLIDESVEVFGEVGLVLNRTE